MANDTTAQQVTPKGKKTVPVTEMPVSLNIAFEKLNSSYCFVEQIAQIVRIPTDSRPFLDIYPPTVFANSLESTRKAEGLPVASKWIRWSGRRTAYQLVYEPGQPRFTGGNLNTWMPSKVKAKKGDITLWLDYLQRVFTTDPTYQDWFLAWLAYPLQHPGTKLHTATVFWSEQTATGKSMLGRIMSAIYGQHNYAQLDEATLHNPFNFWAVGKQFVMGEEIKGASSAKYADRLKAMITQQVNYVNVKYKAQFELRDCLNYYFTSNHPDAFYLDSNDRRFFVHNLGDQKYPADLYRDQFEPWFNNGGAEAIRHYLEHEIDLTKPIVGGDPTSSTPHRFNPGAAAPQSNARKAMIVANLDDVECWLNELLDSPGAILKGDAEAWTCATARELYTLFCTQNKHTKCLPKRFSALLRRQVPPLYSDNKIDLTPEHRDKLYPTRKTPRSGKPWRELGALELSVEWNEVRV